MQEHHTEQPGSFSFSPDVDVLCTTCGYNLRGTTGAACAECGAAFELAGPRQRDRYALYLLALILTSGLAFSAQYFIYVLFDLLTDPGSLFGIYDGLDLLGYVWNLLAIPYLAVLIALRKKIVRSSTGVQLGWVVPPILCTLYEFSYTIYTLFLWY